MKKIFLFSCVIFLCLFILFKSNAWEIKRVEEKGEIVSSLSYKSSFHWDRLSRYIKNIPKELVSLQRKIAAVFF